MFQRQAVPDHVPLTKKEAYYAAVSVVAMQNNEAYGVVASISLKKNEAYAVVSEVSMQRNEAHDSVVRPTNTLGTQTCPDDEIIY